MAEGSRRGDESAERTIRDGHRKSSRRDQSSSNADRDRRRRRSASIDSLPTSPPATKRRRRFYSDSESPPPRRRNRSRNESRSSDHKHEKRRRPAREDDRKDNGETVDENKNRDGPTNRRDDSERRASPRRRRSRSNDRRPSPRRDKDNDRTRSSREDRTNNSRGITSSPRRERAPLPSQQASFRTDDPRGAQRAEQADNRFGRNSKPSNDGGNEPPPIEKEQINLRPTGLLATEANTLTFGKQKITLKYNQPPEGRKPDPVKSPWRLYVFKGTETLDTINLYEKSCWLVGREKAVADIWVESPGVSGQHAVLQFRAVGDARKTKVKLYVLDLESANGTVLNGESVPARRFVEVRGGDVLGFGGSGREYVVMLPEKET